jgi:hypothetical protein
MKKILFLTLALLLVISSAGCAGKAVNSEAEYDSAPNMKGDYFAPEEMGATEDSMSDVALDNGYTEKPSLESDKEATSTNDVANRKLIKRVRMEIQTDTYDELFTAVKDVIASTGAYVQNSTMYDRNGKSSNRSATLIIRVPADKLDEFTNGIYGKATVTYYNEDLEDVTASYRDIESRIESLKIELDALNKLLAEAVDLQYVISLHDRISQIRYELDRYESSIRNYDELISYSTVTLDIREVKRVIIVDEQSTWEEIGSNLSENISDIGEFFRRAFIDITSSLPYLLILGVVFGTVTIIIVVNVKKHRKKKYTEDK